MDTLEHYVRDNSRPQGEALDWLERQSWLRTSHGRQLCGPSVGALLRELVRLLQPRRVLEIGTFSGYSAIWMAGALPEGGRLDTIEINDELEELIREGFDRAGLADRIRLVIGDALDILPMIDETYDLVYIDGNKREYIAYYQSVINLVRPGGYIVADNVLWNGKVSGNIPEDVFGGVSDGVSGGVSGSGSHAAGCEPPRDQQTVGILAFNDLVAGDDRVENFILPLRDGLHIIRKK
ncbi:MAG: O-methyltransferase [Bacteroidales bacterium]|nr:O-methyltransferase [Bacteroidales bacterium]